MVCISRFLSSISCRFKSVKQKVSILNKVTPVDGTGAQGLFWFLARAQGPLAWAPAEFFCRGGGANFWSGQVNVLRCRTVSQFA